MGSPPFVPADFVVPLGLDAGLFRLEPLGPQHNDADYAAWTSSVDHILATPGFAGWGWPHEMTAEENRGDLDKHARDFQEGRGFTYTVLDDAGTVIGCVYIYPSKRDGYDASVRSWVTSSSAELDKPLYDAVRTWLARDWPFQSLDYAPR